MNKNNHPNFLKTAARLLPFLRPNTSWFSINIFMRLCLIIQSIALIYIFQNLIDSALTVQKGQFFVLLNYSLILFVATIAITYFNPYSAALYINRTIYNLRNHISRHLQYLPISFTEKYHTGDITSRLNRDADMMADILNDIPEIFLQPLMLICAISYMIKISWKLTLASICLIPIAAIIMNMISRHLEKPSMEMREYIGKSTAITHDIINGSSIIKAFNLQNTLTIKYSSVVMQIQNKAIAIAKVVNVINFTDLTLKFIPQLVLPVYGGYLILNGEITVGSLLASSMLLRFIYEPIETFFLVLMRLRISNPAAIRLFEIIDHPGEKADQGLNFSSSGTEVPIEFENVTFGYDKGKIILDNLSFSVLKGQKVALVGFSGSGKSTIFKLLYGFYHPQKGKIRVYGNDLETTKLFDIRALMTLMTQDMYLFSGTIRENIALGKSGATEDEIIAAAKISNAHEFITNLSRQYDTVVSAKGVNLSQGQCQRIALARAVLKDTPILLLDEPTAALDTQSEVLIEDALGKLFKNRVIFFIAHRLSTIKDVDLVIVLDHGRIVEKGTHAKLLKEDSIFRRLYLNQTQPARIHMIGNEELNK